MTINKANRAKNKLICVTFRSISLSFHIQMSLLLYPAQTDAQKVPLLIMVANNGVSVGSGG